jgi:hypothetical protein
MPTVASSLKKRDLTTDSIDELLNAPTIKSGCIQIFKYVCKPLVINDNPRNGKWKDRLLRISNLCVIIDYLNEETKVKHHIRVNIEAKTVT